MQIFVIASLGALSITTFCARATPPRRKFDDDLSPGADDCIRVCMVYDDTPPSPTHRQNHKRGGDKVRRLRDSLSLRISRYGPGSAEICAVSSAPTSAGRVRVLESGDRFLSFWQASQGNF